MSDVLDKYEFLGRQTLTLIESNQPTVFVYLGKANESELEEPIPLLGIDGMKRFTVNILLKSEAVTFSKNPKIITLSIENMVDSKPKHLHWQGDDSSWDLAFDALPMKPSFNVFK